MRIFTDAHVVIDYLVNGETAATRVTNNIIQQKNQPVISSLTIAILNYFIDKKFHNPAKKKKIAAAITELFEIATPLQQDIPKILQHHDWEDAFQYYSAKQARCKLIITDNIHDYSFSDIELMNVNTFNSMFL
jgi:predicted nucleic acid-binding protein